MEKAFRISKTHLKLFLGRTIECSEDGMEMGYEQRFSSLSHLIVNPYANYTLKKDYSKGF